MVTKSVSDQEWLDKYLPTDDMDSDPRWTREEFAPGCFVWAWKPATIDLVGGAFVAQVGSQIERFRDLEAADWWCTEAMDVLPVISSRALSVPVDQPRRTNRTLANVMNVAAMFAGFVAVLLPLVVL